ncbi:hypothetical protein [uncultured Sphingomonas sp.]|uniref:hypothetical protein n=1 Tax=uncultured Sphingomonas sp. TaxID=158754 RepID=UPI0025CC85BC|nr:hypothetical protein [uncultured Sphingomonas sp.]
MSKSATDLMQEIIVSSLIDAVAALRSASKGVPNAMLRDLNAIGPNTGFSDLPAELQASIGESVRAAFNRLLKEGYSVAPGTGRAPTRPDRPVPPSGGAPRPRPNRPAERRPRPPRPPRDR